jgi:hypothetical protein
MMISGQSIRSLGSWRRAGQRLVNSTMVMCVGFGFQPSISAWAQQAPTSPAPSLPNPTTGGGNVPLTSGGLAGFFNTRTPYEFWLTCLIVVFGLLVIYFIILSMRAIPNRKAEDVGRSIIIVTVIVGTLVLVTAGYSNDQIAPAFGLFGTIIGYMLGQMNLADARSRTERTTTAGEQHPE